VAWLSNPEIMKGSSALLGKNPQETGDYIAAVYKAVFLAVEETTREATSQGRAARRVDS
jgi:ssDNA-binding replication factor A large subunit